MKKMTKSLLSWIGALGMLVGSLVVGGLFTSGTTLSYPILKIAPIGVHTLIGGAFILGGIVVFIWKVIKAMK